MKSKTGYLFFSLAPPLPPPPPDRDFAPFKVVFAAAENCATAAPQQHQNRFTAALTQLASHPPLRQVMLACSDGRTHNRMKETELKPGLNIPATARSTGGES